MLLLFSSFGLVSPLSKMSGTVSLNFIDGTLYERTLYLFENQLDISTTLVFVALSSAFIAFTTLSYKRVYVTTTVPELMMTTISIEPGNSSFNRSFISIVSASVNEDISPSTVNEDSTI